MYQIQKSDTPKYRRLPHAEFTIACANFRKDDEADIRDGSNLLQVCGNCKHVGVCLEEPEDYAYCCYRRLRF